MIDLTKERIFRLSAGENVLSEVYPESGEGFSYSTLYRLITQGIEIRGEVVKLERCFIGGRVLGTSVEAYVRFCQRLNQLALAAHSKDENCAM